VPVALTESALNASLAPGLVTQPFEVKRYQGDWTVLDSIADEWRRLCDENPGDQPYYRPELIRAYVRAYVPDAKVLVLAVRRAGRLRLVLPLLEEKSWLSGVPVRKLRAPVRYSRFDATSCGGEEGGCAALAVWRHLSERDDWDLLEMRYSLDGSNVGKIASVARSEGFHAMVVPERPNVYVPVPADASALGRMPQNSKLRSQLRQARTRLAALGTLRLTRVEGADRTALDRFYELEASGWKGRAGSAIHCLPEMKPFFDEVAESAARFGYFCLYMLELDGQLMAANFAFNHRGRCHLPRVAYNERFREFAAGHLMVSEVLQDCFSRSMEGIDFTGADDEWKMKWTSQVQSVNHHFLFNSGARGGLAHIVRFKIRPLAGRLLRSVLKAARNNIMVDTPSRAK